MFGVKSGYSGDSQLGDQGAYSGASVKRGESVSRGDVSWRGDFSG